MPLSEHEQRLLEQIERQLYADDPKLANIARHINPRARAIRRLVQSVLLFLVGLGVLLAAVIINHPLVALVVLGLAGFLLMLWSALRAVTEVRRLSGRVEPDETAPTRSRRARRPRRTLVERAEERWRRRWEDH